VAFFFLRKKPDWCSKTTLEEILFKKIMVAGEVFVNFYNFNPITKDKKVIFKVSYMKLSKAGAEAGAGA
jgi:hypothetical protein